MRNLLLLLLLAASSLHAQNNETVNRLYIQSDTGLSSYMVPLGEEFKMTANGSLRFRISPGGILIFTLDSATIDTIIF